MDKLEPIDPNAINVMNIIDADPMLVAKWSAQHLLGISIPEPGPNRSISTIAPDIQTLLAVLPNRQGLATELYGVVTASLANQRVAKKFQKTSDVESAITILTALQDILYRCIQTLQSQIDSCKALNITGNQQSRLDR